MKIRILLLGFSDAMAADFNEQFSRYTNVCCVAASGLDDAFTLIATGTFQLILINLEAIDFEYRDSLLVRLRKSSHAPIVVSTAQYTGLYIYHLASLGVDVVLPSNEQPIIFFTLAAAQLRRYLHYDIYDKPESVEIRPFQVGDVFIDPLRRYAEVKGRFVELRPREFSLLLYFVRNPGAVLTNEQIFEQAWRSDYAQSVGRAVYELRQKIEPDPKHPIYIETVHRVGYRFTAFCVETCGQKETKRKEKGN